MSEQNSMERALRAVQIVTTIKKLERELDEVMGGEGLLESSSEDSDSAIRLPPRDRRTSDRQRIIEILKAHRNGPPMTAKEVHAFMKEAPLESIRVVMSRTAKQGGKGIRMVSKGKYVYAD